MKVYNSESGQQAIGHSEQLKIVSCQRVILNLCESDRFWSDQAKVSIMEIITKEITVSGCQPWPDRPTSVSSRRIGPVRVGRSERVGTERAERRATRAIANRSSSAADRLLAASRTRRARHSNSSAASTFEIGVPARQSTPLSSAGRAADRWASRSARPGSTQWTMAARWTCLSQICIYKA